MMNKVFVFILAFILVTVNVSAQGNFSSSAAFEWLNRTMVNSNWNQDVDEIAMSILALRNGGYEIQGGIDRLFEIEGRDDNFDDIRDTAYAILALYKSGYEENVTEELEWLEDEERLGDTGEWLIQVVAEGNGTCLLDYSDGEKEIDIVDGDVLCGGSGQGSMFNLEQCIQRSVLPFEEFEMQCNDVGFVDISLLYQEGSSYFLLDESIPLEIKDACYGNCRYGDSAIGSWVLYEIGEDDHSGLYLDINRDEDVIGNSVLSLLSDDDKYTTWLVDNQQLSGSWNRALFETAFAYMVLENSVDGRESADKAVEWIEEQQDDDGSFNEDIFNTAFVLFALTSEPTGGGPMCGDGFCGAGETPTNCPIDCGGVGVGFCGDNLVSEWEDCETDSDCLTGEECDACSCVPISEQEECSTDDECMSDFDCETDEVCDACSCVASTSGGGGDGGGDSGGGEEKGGGFLVWAFIIVGVILLLVGAYFFYMRRKGGEGLSGGKTGSPKTFEEFLKTREQSVPLTRTGIPRQQQYAPRRAYSEGERELDEAISKAKNLIGKK